MSAPRPDNGPAFSVDTVNVDGEARLIVRGEIDLAARDALLRAVQEATASKHRIVVDLSHVSFLDLTGIAVFAGAAVDGSDVSLLDPQPFIRRTLELSGLDKFVPIVSGDNSQDVTR